MSHQFLLLAFSLIFLSLGHNCISLDNDENLMEMQRRLRYRIPCNNKQLIRRMYQKGKFWVVQNFAAADHGQLECHSAVTLTTIADIGHLNNLDPLVRSWRAPISLTLYAPGEDLHPTLDSIIYLRNCLRNTEDSNMIRELVSFHLIFDLNHVTQDLPPSFKEDHVYCEHNPMKMSSFRSDHGLTYFRNLARNVAQDAAITHFILPIDIDLLPSERLVPKFLRMIAFDERPIIRNRVYAIPAFNVTGGKKPPTNKRRLIEMLYEKSADELQDDLCKKCNIVPQLNRWKQIPDSDDLKILSTVRRTGEFLDWEPYFIASQPMPYFEERQDGFVSDRGTQATILCLLDYEFSVLDNVFLVHHPKMKMRERLDVNEDGMTQSMNLTRKIIPKKWIDDYISMFGPRPECYL